MNWIKQPFLRIALLLMLCIVYYLFLTPLVLIAKFSGKQFLETDLDNTTKTYWRFKNEENKNHK